MSQQLLTAVLLIVLRGVIRGFVRICVWLVALVARLALSIGPYAACTLGQPMLAHFAAPNYVVRVVVFSREEVRRHHRPGIDDPF